jgi:ion channel-forming bestrophin family protein
VITKRNFSPIKVAGYFWRPMLAVLAVSLLAVLLRTQWPHQTWFIVPFAPIGTLGTALAILVGLRANASYQKWWEARTLWQNIQNSSRVFTRLMNAAAADAIANGKGGTPEEVRLYTQDVVYRLIAFCYALRARLRGTGDLSDLDRLLPAADAARLHAAHNVPNVLLGDIAVKVKAGVRAERIGSFDPISLEPNLVALSNAAGLCERTDGTPTPRQYSFFARVGVALFAALLPFGLLSFPSIAPGWVVVISFLVSWFFLILEKTGEVLDAPFENTTNDVPLDALCRAIERDLREQLGESELPDELVPVAGYLW